MTRTYSAYQLAPRLLGATAAGLAVLAIIGLIAQPEGAARGVVLALVVGLLVTAVAALAWLATTARPTEVAEMSRLEEAALTDHLTGLGNHRAFQEDLARELSRKDPRRRPLSLVMLDMDGLKLANDSLGHQAGDEMIIRLASGLRQTMRDADSAYRIGGDEFAVILPAQPMWGAFRFAQRLQANLATLPLGQRVSASAGVAEARDHDRDELIRAADLALIAAKRGRRGVLIYTDDLEPRVRSRDVVRVSSHVETLAAALARAVDSRDHGDQGHSETVAELSAVIAEHLGLAPERVAQVRLAGLMHDVGKIGIPEAILRKPGALTPEEILVARSHVELGGRIVAGAGFAAEADWILHHHERIDGRGYPDGLAGDEIPIESRIIFVADAFEALTSDRPYRPALGTQEALDELRRHAGTQFCPMCVAAIEEAFRPVSAPVSLDSPDRSQGLA